MEKDCVDLLQLQHAIRQGLELSLPEAIWVRAEIASLSVNRNGHCYLDLCQNREGSVVAQARAVIWSGVFRQIAPYFASVTGERLSSGQQVMLEVSVNYSEIYGLSLIVSDIDPDYTLGDNQRRKNETLQRLESEGMLEMQKELAMPALPYEIAVVSAEGAAGYGDFMRHLHENVQGFRFSTTLFPSPMQGADCASGVASALAAIELDGRHFDATVIVRGGGGQLDLGCYDEYEMCAAIARHPFPVLTAIGHDRDTHLCDAVAWEALKTPTALADFFIDIYAGEDARLSVLLNRLKGARRTRFAQLQGRLDVLRARLEAADPRRLVSRGYLVVCGSDGCPVRSTADVASGDTLSLVFPDGRVQAVVTGIEDGKI